ncbi:MAG: MotA/TolQ/ExbB proton channel family protein [Candidatus Omnitrophota bacterium]|nr:MAG: MotA/TolQ/ExbB proton channel family protein [Candidatus Omnitrophota bacterium]
MLHLIVKGGWLMLPILICSIFSLAIIIERIFFFSSIKFDTHSIIPQILEFVRTGRTAEAVEVCDKKPFHVTNILKAGFLHYDESKEIVKESMEDASLYEIPKLEKNLHFLSTIAHIAPLIGLLGTVVGLVKCFYVIEQKTVNMMGVVNPADLAGGIWEALLTTVAGLCVAIPTYIAYNYFVQKVNLLVLESERAATELLEVHSERRYACEV